MDTTDRPAAAPRSVLLLPRRAVGLPAGAVALSVGLVALPLLICACGATVEGEVAVPGPPGAVVVADDEYDYYPAYGVYYNPYRRMYYYSENGGWVMRASPPGVGVDVFFGSPHVRMGFHDHPQYHHDEVIRRYPRGGAEHRGQGQEERGPERR